MNNLPCGEAAINDNHSGEAAIASPCIYSDLKHCGKKFDLFYYDENLSLTKRSEWEKLVLQQMNEWGIENRKIQNSVIDSIELILPVAIFISFLSLLVKMR
jgi:hypothetical protein